jgi:DNA polymerase-3 subunit gamma/tau
MSYQVLARKWRPQFFKDMVGQEHVLRALINALDNQRLHHAYLFTGTRGVGKTTIARILAKCLNCEQGITSEPCGTCDSCVEITEGRFVDLIEVDAASRTKVEDTREILDNVQYAPTRGRFKVYLIDEVHMLSNSSFNALLKTLEEPPPHVKFLLATTDPQKLPATVLSRCLQFSLKNMTPERIVGYLKTVLDKETISFEEPGLWLLGKAAEGSMRDALSLTDQSISFGEGKIIETDVASMLGTVDRGRVFKLAIALAEANAVDTMALIAQMAEHAVDFNNLLADLLGLIHRIAIAQAVPDAVDNSQGDKEQVMTLARAMNPDMVQLLYQVALTGKRDLPLAPDPRAGMEMTLLRMLNFAPIGSKVGHVPPATTMLADMEEPPAKKPELAPTQRQVNERADSATPALAAPELNEAVSSSDVEDELPPWNIDPIDPSDLSDQRPVTDISVTVPAQALVAESPYVAQPEVLESVASSHPTTEVAPAHIIEQKPAPVTRAHSAQQARAEVQVDAPIPAPLKQEAPKSAQPEPLVQVNTEVAATQPDHADVLNMTLSSQSWPVMFTALPLEGMLRNLVANTCLMSIDGSNLLFHSDAGHMRLFGESHQQKFNQILNATLNSDYKVQVIEGDIQYETPAQRHQRLVADRLQAAVESIEQDPKVQALRQSFNAQVIMDSITPLNA